MDLRITHIIEDTRQKEDGSHDNIKRYMDAEGIKLIRSKLLIGDYALATNQSVVIDTKQNLTESYSNILDPRFHRECQLAHELGIHLVILVEDPTIRSLDEVPGWENPRFADYDFVKAGREHGWFKDKSYQTKPPMASSSLHKAMCTISERYGVEWVFCSPVQTGAYIHAILTKGLAQAKAKAFHELFDILTQK